MVNVHHLPQRLGTLDTFVGWVHSPQRVHWRGGRWEHGRVRGPGESRTRFAGTYWSWRLPDYVIYQIYKQIWYMMGSGRDILSILLYHETFNGLIWRQGYILSILKIIQYTCKQGISEIKGRFISFHRCASMKMWPWRLRLHM